ncbi:MAG: hypothetical protein K2X00_20705 [Nitrospiraceae bacterium]|nr:hypothetical protein [Nitrospiraceae bacterium]
MIAGGDMRCCGKDDLASAIRACLSKNDGQLSVEQLLALKHNPKIIHDLGARKQLAREQVQLLGNIKTAAAPPWMSACIREAAGGDAKNIETLMAFIKSILPQGPVRHQWIGVRLLISRWPNLRKSDFSRLAMAMKHVRSHPDFQGWWSKTPVGSQNPAIYHRPKLEFDL